MDSKDLHGKCNQACCVVCVSIATGRRSAPPLNLTGLPGTEKLNEREKEVRRPMSKVGFQTRFRIYNQGVKPGLGGHIRWLAFQTGDRVSSEGAVLKAG